MEKKNQNSNRREFLKKAGLLFGAGAAVTSLSSLIVGCKDETIPLPPTGSYNISLVDYPDLEVVDSVVKCDAVFNLDPAQKLTVIVRSLAGDKFVIVQSQCSHQGDQPLPGEMSVNGNVVCPRHLAEFSLKEADPGVLVVNPNNISAPGLKVYNYEYKKDQKLIVIES